MWDDKYRQVAHHKFPGRITYENTKAWEKMAFAYEVK